VVLAILTGGLWLPLAGRFLVVEDPLPPAGAPADAVVPLGGGGVHRVAGAASLLRDGYATWLLTADDELDLPGIRQSLGELVRQEAEWQGVPAERVLVLPGSVETTWQEALALRRLVDRQGWHSLLVLTDPFHTRRARLCFREAFRDSGVAVSVRAIEGSWYDPGSWWLSTDGLRETWTEVLKLALHLVGYR
jgi:uncharacterized SAM-binding protein YcdF (DUF218 family)